MNYGRHTVHEGDCLDLLRSLPDGSVDALVTDPPYPEIHRPYGRWSGDEWRELLTAVLVEARRVLTPTGSAILIIKPQMLHIGRMSPAIFRLAADLAEEAIPGWGIVQDTYWWNHTTPPVGGTPRHIGLLRPSVAWCLWLGPESCYRSQDSVLWTPSDGALAKTAAARADRSVTHPGGVSMNYGRVYSAMQERGGVTPFNLLPIPHEPKVGKSGHSAGTPHRLANWWLRYLVPNGGTVLDPFLGSGTTMLEADRLGLTCIGAEAHPPHWSIIADRWATHLGMPAAPRERTPVEPGSILDLFGEDEDEDAA